MLTVLIKILCILLIVVERAETKNQTNISSSNSAFAEVLSVYLKGSTLGPLLFNIYICDLFLENSDIDIAKHADDNTPYTFSSDLDSVIF